MKVTAMPHGLDLLKSDLKRSPGLHMSTLYNSLYEELEPKRYIKGSKPEPALLATGIALERYTEWLLVNAGLDAHRPDEFRTPDQYAIAFSPDLLIANGEMKGGEIKATFQSMRGWPEDGETVDSIPQKAGKYLTQAMAYGHNLEIPTWVFFIWFLKGKYERSNGLAEDSPLSKLRKFQMTFTAREMREEYAMLINHGKGRGLL